MDVEPAGPKLRQVVLDTEDARGLAEFYRRLLGLEYRSGDAPPPSHETDDADWLVLRGDGGMALAFQQVAYAPRSTWPDRGQAQMLHLDLTVDDVHELHRQRDRAVALGATVLQDRSDDAEEPLFVLADPAGHPFCIFVA